MAQEFVLSEHDVKPGATFRLFPHHKDDFMIVTDDQTSHLRYRIVNLNQGVVTQVCYSKGEVVTFLNKWKAFPTIVTIEHVDYKLPETNNTIFHHPV